MLPKKCKGKLKIVANQCAPVSECGECIGV